MTTVFDPLTGRPERKLRPPQNLPQIAADLRSAQHGWGATDRRAALAEFGSRLAGDQPLRAALAADTGRRLESEMECALVARMVDRWIRQAPEVLRSDPETPSQSAPWIWLSGAWHPYELVGAITPWNFPLLLGLIDAIPALAAGCAVLVKPSEVTPRFIEPLMKLVPDELPLNVIEGDGGTGAAMIGLVDIIAFTGSVAVGRQVAEAAARAFIPCFLELGGKDPAIVLPGADLERAASALLWGAVFNTGQSCLSIERIYTPRDSHDEFVALLAAKARAAALTFEGGRIGPLIDPAQAHTIQRHLSDAVARGAKVITGGAVERHGGGHWCRPTVLTEVDHSMLVMTEETFGPVLPVMRYDTVDEAVNLANDSPYGLSAAVFGPGARQVAGRLRVGAVSIDDAALVAIVQEAEKNPFNLSGLGASRMGPAAVRRFLRRTAFLTNRSPDPDPRWLL